MAQVSKQRQQRPDRQANLNGEHVHIWDMLWYLAGRQDDERKLIIGFGTGIIVAVVVGWLTVMAQL